MKLNTPLKVISPEAGEELLNYDWPGNVRELQNIIEYAANLCETDTLMPSDLPSFLNLEPASSDIPEPVFTAKSPQDTELLEQLEKYGYTLEGKKQIAVNMGISLRTLYRRISKLYNSPDGS